ncbi:MAG: hypothetical protein WC438_01745 [Candidatus Pacearchaeota archaeon]
MELEGDMVGGRFLHHYFKIETKKGTPFPEEPNLEAHFSSSSSYGASLILHDKSQDFRSEPPRLEAMTTKYGKINDLTLFVIETIPENHLLARNRDKIINRCQQAADELRLSFVNRFYLGYSEEQLKRAIYETFNLASQEVLKRSSGLNENIIQAYSSDMSFIGMTPEEFKRKGLRFFSDMGLEANSLEKLNLLKIWREKLAGKNFF